MKKVISIKKEKILFVIYLIIIAVSTVSLINNSKKSITTFSMPLSNKVIVLDAGHGGFDPGRVSGKNYESDINLAITLKLQQYLEQSGAYVINTRATKDAIGKDKNADMRNRKYVANISKGDILLSIHQNAYANSSTRGPQVFYFDKSENSKLLASKIQSRLNSFTYKKREVKPNENYYILKKTVMPTVIVECGFMTNSADLANLLNDSYQSQLAWNIYLGILDYFNQTK